MGRNNLFVFAETFTSVKNKFGLWSFGRDPINISRRSAARNPTESIRNSYVYIHTSYNSIRRARVCRRIITIRRRDICHKTSLHV